MLVIPYQDDQGTPTLFNTKKEYVHWTNWDPARTHRELSHLACAYVIKDPDHRRATWHDYNKHDAGRNWINFQKLKI